MFKSFLGGTALPCKPFMECRTAISNLPVSEPGMNGSTSALSLKGTASFLINRSHALPVTGCISPSLWESGKPS